MNLKEEKATDKKLTGIAKRKINRKAAARKLPKPDRSRARGKRHAGGSGGHSGDLTLGLNNHALFLVAIGLPAQPIDATQVLNLSAGVSNCKVSRGRSLS